MIAASLFSGGKESVHAIYTVEKQGVEVEHLLHLIPTFKSPHAQNIEALKTLAKSMNKNFAIVDLHNGKQELVNTLRNLKVNALVAGDINVPEHITWHNDICNQAGVKLLEPLFGKETSALFNEMFREPLGSRFKATIIGVNTKQLGEEWLGFTLSNETADTFLSKTQHIDPLGENGEFHTIVVESPLYSSAFKITPIEKIIEKDIAYLRISLSESSG
jgi:uncharacterized protein (TIGR00290 family)